MITTNYSCRKGLTNMGVHNMDEQEVDRPESADNDVRSQLLGDVAGFLVTIGYAMSSWSQQTRDKAGTAIATCVQISGDLARGIQKLTTGGNYYASASLGRQVLESTQLIQYFSIRPEHAEFWLTATDAQMKRATDFKPKQLREATAASNRVYDRHCALGGHPRSIARILLPGSPFRRSGEIINLSAAGFNITTDVRALVLTDSLQHLYDATLATIEVLDVNAFKELGELRERSEQLTDDLLHRLIEWRNMDPLAAVGYAE
jgi:hypothetical protein